MIKLNHKVHVYNILQQKPINQFWKKWLKTSKTPNLHWSKNYPNNAWKLKINEKGRVIWSYQPWERKTLQKDRRKTTKKLVGCLDRSNRERKSVWNFWKVFKHVKKQGFLKTLYTTFDWSKNRFDRSKMFRLIQHQSSTDRNRQRLTKILIAILIGRETSSINRNSGKNKFLKNKANLCRNSSKYRILWIKCMSMRWNAFQKHLFWTQFSQN